MQRALNQMNLQVCMGFEITVTVCTEFMIFRVLDLVGSELLFGTETGFARHAFVGFHLQFSSSDSSAGAACIARATDDRCRDCDIIVFGVVGVVRSITPG